MPIEIERKFLVLDDSWRRSIRKSLRISDHLIAQFEAGKARIRFCDSTPTLTIKGLRRGTARREFHISLSEEDATSMVDEFSARPAIAKTRCEVEVAGLIWQVDEYEGALSGLVMTDVELPNEHFNLTVPSWVGPEITGDRRFSSTRLADALAGKLADAQNVIADAEHLCRASASEL